MWKWAQTEQIHAAILWKLSAHQTDILLLKIYVALCAAWKNWISGWTKWLSARFGKVLFCSISRALETLFEMLSVLGPQKSGMCLVLFFDNRRRKTASEQYLNFESSPLHLLTWKGDFSCPSSLVDSPPLALFAKIWWFSYFRGKWHWGL